MTENAHLTICIEPDGSFSTYPDGDPQQILQALRTLVRVLAENPEAALCIARACDGHAHDRKETLQ